jgi:hypothetical protein
MNRPGNFLNVIGDLYLIVSRINETLFLGWEVQVLLQQPLPIPLQHQDEHHYPILDQSYDIFHP